MDVPKLIRNFNYTTGTFPENTKRKNYFLAACLLLDKNCDVLEVNIVLMVVPLELEIQSYITY